MKVCIIRNAKAESNAGVLRVIDALKSCHNHVFTLTRNRGESDYKNKIQKKLFDLNNQKIKNYQFNYQSDMDKGISNLFNLAFYQFRMLLWLILNNKKFDAIHAFDLDAGLPSFIATRLFRKKFIYHIADFYVDSRRGIPNKIKEFIRTLECFIISRADITIICTEERKSQIVGSNPKKLIVVHNSPVKEINVNYQDEKKIYKEYGKVNDKSILEICYVGGLSEIRFINEILNIVKDDSRFSLKIAGYGPLQEEVERCTKNYNNITYLGQITYQEALKLYSKSDIMFAMYDPKHPNHRYSAPNKVYEAMMLHKPIIVAKNTGIDLMIQKEKIGFVVDYKINSFKEILNYIFNHQEVITEIEENSEKAYVKYSWASMRKRICEAYKSLE